MSHRGFTDDGVVYTGFFSEPQLKRALVDRATERGVSLSEEIRSVLTRDVWPDRVERSAELVAA